MTRRFIYLFLAAALLASMSTAEAAARSTGGSMVASVAACPHQEELGASIEAQERAMRCMTNFARERVGLDPLADSASLDASAQHKTADLLACDSFSHEACGRAFTYWMRQTGYTDAPCWRVGENLAWGTGAGGTVRSIFRAWLHSPEHRHNILGNYGEMGLDLSVGELEGRPSAHVWTAHFGIRC